MNHDKIRTASVRKFFADDAGPGDTHVYPEQCSMCLRGFRYGERCVALDTHCQNVSDLVGNTEIADDDKVFAFICQACIRHAARLVADQTRP